MSKYFKLAWSGNILKKELNAFNRVAEKDLDIKFSNASGGGAVVGDFNGDGYQDVLATYSGKNYDGVVTDDPSHGQLILFLGTAKGAFKNGTNLLSDHGRVGSVMWTSPTVGDFNGDGVDDVVLAGSWEDGRRIEMDAPWQRADQLALMSSPTGPTIVDLNFQSWGRSSSAGDFNGDGLEDFILDSFQGDATTGKTTCIYLQNADGTLTQAWIDEHIANNIVETGDFDGDGDDEIAGWTAEWGPEGPISFGMQTYEVNPDGSLGERKLVTKPIDRLEEGINWNGARQIFTIMKDENGEEYADYGIHFADTGDLNGDGKDDIAAAHFAYNLHYNKDGVLTELGGGSRQWIDIFTMTENGLESSQLELRGWAPPKQYSVENIDLIDWNGDGHLDIFVPWEFSEKGVKSLGAQIFLNDGTGNFDRMPQKYIPGGSAKGNSETADAIDANGDGIMDLLIRTRSFSDEWNDWGKYSENLYLGKRIFGDGTTHNPAKQGAAGFNEAYYLGQIDGSGVTLKTSGFQSALDHYLSVGKASGAFGFAAGTHVYGYGGSETIVLREGNESVDAAGGDDILIGAGGADILNGGRGADIFVYLAVTDSGTTDASRDVIEDFVAGTDEIDLSAIDAVANTPSNDAFTLLSQDGAAFAAKAGELRWYSLGSGADAIRIIEGDVDGDGVADFQLELRGAGAIAASDLVL